MSAGKREGDRRNPVVRWMENVHAGEVWGGAP